MILLTALFLIFFKAIPDGILLRKYKTAFWLKNYKAIASLFMTTLFAVTILLSFACLMGISFNYGDNYWFVIIGFLLMKFAIFDPIHNLVAGLKISFIGTTKFWDRFWQWFFKTTRFPVSFLSVLRCISFLIGFSFLMGWQDGIK